MSAARFFIVGKVQGVCFRASTCERARRLGLRGHARNLSDGRVEVVAVGELDALEQLAVWLRNGPPLARVDELQRWPAEDTDAGAEFHVR